MVEVYFVVNDSKTGKSYQKVLAENPYVNKKVGDKVQGSLIGLDGYELEIKGGSDKSGCPIRHDMPGFGKKRALLSSGPCVKGLTKGQRIRKTVAGNLINQDIVQLNLKIIKAGSGNLEELMPKIEKKEKG